MEQIGSFILNHWLLFLALLVVFSLLLMNTARSRLLGFQELNATEAVQMMNHDEPLLLDTRSADEFTQGHILGALNIPQDRLPERLGELDTWRARKIIVYCRTGQRSAVAAAQLKKAGFEHVHKLKGGILAWQGAGLPLTEAAATDAAG